MSAEFSVTFEGDLTPAGDFEWGPEHVVNAVTSGEAIDVALRRQYPDPSMRLAMIADGITLFITRLETSL